jgi:hypothetical protein
MGKSACSYVSAVWNGHRLQATPSGIGDCQLCDNQIAEASCTMTAVLRLPNSSEIIRLLSIAVYALSLTQPGICISGGCDRWPPWSMLLMGFLQFLTVSSSLAGICWLANPLLFLAWIFSFRVRYGLAFRLSWIALAMALSLVVTRHVLASESGNVEYITAFASGYWLWVGSIALMVLSTLLSDTLAGKHSPG